MAPRRTPVIPDLTWDDLTDGDADELGPDELLEARRYTDVDLAQHDLSGIRLIECELVGIGADDAQFGNARLVHTRLDRLSASTLKAARTSWQDVRIEASRLGAVELYESGLRAVVVKDCRLSWLNLRATSLRDVVFDGCVFEELDLTDAKAERVAFRECRAQSIRFDNARLKHVDLRGLEISTLSGIDGLRGTIMSSAQSTLLAELFAAELGITVTDAP